MFVLSWSWALFLILVSTAVGSFLGVLVDRLPMGRSILTRSTCASCERPLRWRDMVPILSALALRGECAGCGGAIPGHLIRVELAALCAAILALVITDTPLQLWLTVLFFWCLVALFYSDLLHMRLPDPLTGALFGLGLALAWTDPTRGWVEPVLSGFGAAAVFWLLRWGYFRLRSREGLGLGDVKLMAGLGAALGWALLPTLTLIAALMGLFVAALARYRGETSPTGDTEVPFGSYLIGAALLLLIYTPQLG